MNGILLKALYTLSSNSRLLEELNEYQHNKVIDWDEENSYNDHVPKTVHDKVFQKFTKDKKADRLVIPFTPTNVPVPTDIANHLDTHGYSVKDYYKGTAIDGNGTEHHIKDVLANTNAHNIPSTAHVERVNFGMKKVKESDTNLLDKFNTDVNRRGHDKGGLQIVVTRNSVDVAGHATDKKYRSCMQMPKFDDDPNEGMNAERIQADLFHKSLAAFVTDKDETNLDNAHSVVLLKRYQNKERHGVYRPSYMAHGDQIHGAMDAVSTFAKANYPVQKGTEYKLARDLYKNCPEKITE